VSSVRLSGGIGFGGERARGMQITRGRDTNGNQQDRTSPYLLTCLLACGPFTAGKGGKLSGGGGAGKLIEDEAEYLRMCEATCEAPGADGSN